MFHPDTNNNNRHEDATYPYQPVPQSPRVTPDDAYRGWTDPDQYVQPGSGQHLGENYGPSAFPAQEEVRQNPVHPAQTIQSSRPDYPNAGNPGLASNNTQTYQPPLWSTPVPPNAPPNYPGYVPAPNNRPPSGSRGWRAGAILALTLVLLLVFGVGLFAGWVFAQNGATGSNTFSGLQTNSNSKATVPAVNNNSSNLDVVREAVISKVEPAVVQINVTLSNGSAIGSGVIIDKRGYIVTNNHVVTGSQTIQVVLANNAKYTAQITGTDATDDLAVIKIDAPADLVTAALGNSAQLRVGQEVLAIGNPLGITQTVTRGIVSALNRNVSEGQSTSGSGPAPVIPSAIQTDAPINPGNSGGALVDLNGNVIGIPTLGAIDPQYNQTANGVGFAIPSNRVSFIVQQLIASGKVTHSGRAAMGIQAQSVDPNTMPNLAIDHGVLIASVVNSGPAQSAGLKAKDVIVQIDNNQIDSLSSLQDALLSKNPGDKISVKVYRGSQQLTFNLTLTELQVASN